MIRKFALSYDKSTNEKKAIFSEGEVDLLEISRRLWQNKLLILAVTAIFTIGGAITSLLLPKTYLAEATLLPMTDSNASTAIAAGIASQLGPMAGMLGGMSGNKSADLTEVLNSRTMANRVISRHQLDNELTGWKHPSELTTKLLKMTTVIAPTIKSKSLIISVQAPTPELASRIANAYVTELKDMLDEIGYNSATKNRKFIESKLNKTKTELEKAEESLTKFQASNQIASLPETVLSSMRTVSELEAQKIAASVELQSTNEAMDEIRSRISMLQATPESLTQLEIKRKSLLAQEAALADAQKTYLSKLVKLPPKAMALARLQRDVQVHNAIYLALTQQYQTALINESKDSDLFLPLDPAESPLRPSKPNKLAIMLVSMMIGVSVSSMFVIIRDLIKR